MNNLVSIYNVLKNVTTFEGLVRELYVLGMPVTQGYQGTERPLFDRCWLLGRDWVRFQYARQRRPKATVPDVEFDGAVEISAWEFYSILMAGETKTLFLMTQEASAFIEETALTEEFTPEFFQANLKSPLVLYAGEPKSLFDDVLAISITYNPKDDEVGCLFSVQDPDSPSREFGRRFSLEELKGRFSPANIAVDETSESTLYMIRQGFVSGKDQLDEKMYRVMLYALKFILLRQCDKQPLVVERQYAKKNNLQKQKEIFGHVNYQRVSLTTTYRAAVTSRDESTETTMVLDKEGRTLQAIRVVGFLRRQHYGPGNSQTKWVYIDAHDSHAWKKEGIRIVRVVR